MLNRRILRIKAFKALYTSALTKGTEKPMTLADAEYLLDVSCESTRDLYLFMLGIVSPLTKIAQERIAAVQKKRVLTEEEKNPNMKFAQNALAKYLDSDRDFQKLFKKKNFDWTPYDIVLKKILDSAVSKEYFEQYMASPTISLAEDCRLFTKIFEEELVGREDLDAILEDMSIYWNDDLAYALTQCCRTFEALAKGEQWSLPLLYQSEMMSRLGKTVDSDKEFVVKLLRAGYSGYEKYSEMISEAVSGWEKDRMVATDVCLIVMGLAEIKTFPNIPVKVSMNEFVEISKYYGSLKSPVFGNGLLDRLVKKLAEAGEINKL